MSPTLTYLSRFYFYFVGGIRTHDSTIFRQICLPVLPKFPIKLSHLLKLLRKVHRYLKFTTYFNHNCLGNCETGGWLAEWSNAWLCSIRSSMGLGSNPDHKKKYILAAWYEWPKTYILQSNCETSAYLLEAVLSPSSCM